jgi:signal transduction histidine kinase
LEDSLQELTKSINSIGRVQIRLKTKGIKRHCLSQDLHLCIYRIAQEQLNNILKYAAASEAVIFVSNTEYGLRMEIADNGTGFDLNAKRSGIGFLNMKTRAENFGGTLHIQSAPGLGTKLLVAFPSL